MEDKHILKNLKSLIRNATIKYSGEYVWQDVMLTEDFKKAYSDYLENNGYSIEFFDSTAIITTRGSKYIFVPNEWFVIASYPVGVFKELMNYKSYFMDISEDLGKRPDDYAKHLRDSASLVDQKEYAAAAEKIVRNRNPFADDNQVSEAVERLWRFVNDYSWWSGQKTIDRGDFYISVVLNMLNLVNASQGYVADIVNAYGTDYKLGPMVKELDGFTVNMTCNIVDKEISRIDLYKEDADSQTANILREANVTYGDAPAGRTRLKIKSTTSREIKYKK